MNGNVAFVGLNFQERVEEEHLKKEGNNGEAYWGIRARKRAYRSRIGSPSLPLSSDCQVSDRCVRILEL